MRLWLFIFFLVSVYSNVQPVSKLDLDSYLGYWYEVYQDNFDKTFQKEASCAVAYYSKKNDNKISVLNSQIDKNNRVDQISGYAYYKDDDTGGKLTVHLNGVPMDSPYWVVELGPIKNNYYQYSIVTDNLQLSLFVLVRDVNEFYEKYNEKVLESLEKMGFTNKINHPEKMDQDNCDYSRYNMTLLH